MRFTTKMKTAFASFAVTIFIALPLFKQFFQPHLPGGKYTEVAMQWHNPLIFLQGKGAAYSNCFLTNTTEPFTDFSLPEQ
ncbi:hypothetical protein D3C86_2024130 [compost metagenome]